MSFMIIRSKHNIDLNKIIHEGIKSLAVSNWLYVLLILSVVSCDEGQAPLATETNEVLSIFPDYKGVSIPVNIAPLNFDIELDAEDYFVELLSNNHRLIPTIKNNTVIIPIGKWRDILRESVKDSIKVRVFAKQNNEWFQYNDFYFKVKVDEMDPYIAYRSIGPGYEKWYKMGIYQRQVSSYHESAVFKNSYSSNNCMNCHSVNAGNPNEFMFHLRAKPSGTYIRTEHEELFLDTKTAHTLSAGVYPSWHPSGKFIAMSTNKIKQVFHNHKNKAIDVFDKASDIIVLDIEKRQITTTPYLASYNRENMPTWSPDGKYLYFIRAKQVNDSIQDFNARYDLLRIAFNAETVEWGKLDTVFEASQLNKSVTYPRISPDGKFLLLTMADYGYFTIHHPEADLYMYDLEKDSCYALSAANSAMAESYHSWSSNGRWIVFSSKRLDGVSGRPYFSYVNEEGQCDKPFVLPLKNPKTHWTRIHSYNIPEFMIDKINIPTRDIKKSINGVAETVTFDSSVNVSSISGATSLEDDKLEPYRN